MLVASCGFAASGAWTVAGLIAAYRSGMRVWIGEGVNQARTLRLGMLITALALGVLVPLTVWVATGGVAGAPTPAWPAALGIALGYFGCMFGAPVPILVVLDWLSRRIVAERPGKFGAKVPTVGKW